jgi:uncharacterized protein (DUF488 family)
MPVYSIGHSSLPGDVFLSHLERFHIVRLADVRRYPRSRRHPQFHRKALEELLAKAGIEYLHFGEALGGFRETSYEEHMSTESFAGGISALLEHARHAHGGLAFMCAEKNPWECHRRFIAEELARRGLDVRHIVDGELLLTA